MDVEMKDNDIARGFLDLPLEIIELILMQNVADFRDVISVSKVCTYLQNIGRSNEIWRHKFRQRWPSLIERFDKSKSYNWYEEFRTCITFQRNVHSLVEGMSAKYYNSQGVSKEQFSDYVALFDKHDLASGLVIYELMGILKNRNESLTVKYYAEKALRYIQQTVLTEQFREFLELPPEQQSLEIGATLLAQWCQPLQNITKTSINDQLDALAAEVKHEISKTDPNHPLAEHCLNNQEAPDYTSGQTKKVLDALNRVLFTVHKFTGNSHNYYTKTNSYIDKVLERKTGIPISLSILYMSVARRLGVICEPVNFPRHFLLRWKEHLHLPRDQMYTYIDVFNEGKFLHGNQLEREFRVSTDGVIETTQPVEVLLRMLRNLIMINRQLGNRQKNLMSLHDVLCLHQLLTPQDISVMLQLAEVSVFMNLYVEELHDLMNETNWIDPHNVNGPEASYWSLRLYDTYINNKEVEQHGSLPTTRTSPDEVIYSVGLIMKHRRYNYICVIYGWDETCQASQEWIQQMGVNNLPLRDQQPFYNVLVDDGSNRYAAQESLEFCKSPQTISHPQVGKYFKSFNGIHYIPNAEKAAEYPEDLEMTQRLAAQL